MDEFLTTSNYSSFIAASINPLNADDMYKHHATLAAFHFEDRFCASKKDGIGGGE